jgi:hypothetical protein
MDAPVKPAHDDWGWPTGRLEKPVADERWM